MASTELVFLVLSSKYLIFQKIDFLETAFYFRIIVQDALTWIEQVNYGMKKVFLVEIQLIFHVAKFGFVIEV